MALVYADRVKETTTTTGTGTLDLDGASSGFQTFVAGVATASRVTYTITNGTDWEIGIGAVTDASPDTLSRLIVLRSSNADALVSWGAGTKDVFLTIAANHAAYPRNHIDGLITSIGTDTDHDIDLVVGECVDSTNEVLMQNTSVLVKQIDVNWAVGTAAGGFPSGLTLTADTWYHYFILAKPDGTIDAGWDTSLSATNLLSDATGYTLFRRVASHLTDSSSNILGFSQTVDTFLWDAVVSFNSVNGGTSAQLLTIDTPLGLSANALLVIGYADNSVTGSTFWLTTSPLVDDTVPASAYRDGRTDTDGDLIHIYKNVVTNTSSQVRVRHTVSTADHVVRLYLEGYTDSRGKG